MKASKLSNNEWGPKLWRIKRPTYTTLGAATDLSRY